MEAAEARRAVTAAMSVAAALDLAVDDAVVLNNSNRLVARLLPCDIVARVSPMGWFSAAREVELARRLAEETDGPVAGLDPRVEPRIVVRDGFEIAMWTYFEPAQSRELPPGDYAHALERLHGALRRVDMTAPHSTDRLAEIQRWLADGDTTPDLTDEDRELLADRIANPGRCSSTAAPPSSCCTASRTRGTCSPRRTGCSSSTSRTAPAGRSSSTLRGFPNEVSERYRAADQELVGECRTLVLALIAAHRWRRDDQHASGRQSGVAFLNVLRAGPPWPALDAIHW